MKLPVILHRWVLALLGFLILVAAWSAGRWIQALAHWPLPGPVIGIALIAALLILLGRLSPPAAAAAAKVMTPPSRLLIAHLGLLFVPAGVGIMTQGDLLRRQWLPIVAALLVSTAVGISVTGWLMQRLAPVPPAGSR